MSRFYVDDYKADIASVKEILFIFVVFATILYFIYPDEILQEYALKEKKNYALSSIYLENMLRLDPKNVDLLFASIEADLGSGRVDLAKNLIGLLRESVGKKDEKKIYLLQYKLYMQEEQRVTDNNESIELKNKMVELLNRASQAGSFEEKYAFVWYKYALMLSQKEAALSFIKPIYERGDAYALEQCAYLSNDLNRTKEKIYCTEKLTNIDDNKSKKWLESAYAMYSESGNTKQALKMIRKLAQKDPSYTDELARVELREQQFIESSKTFMSLYKSSFDEDDKKVYLLNAIQSLTDGEKNDEAVALMQKYEDRYIKDEKMMQQFIKLYLAIGRLKPARELSIRLLKDGTLD